MKFLKFWFPVVLYSGIIFYVSGLPNLEVPLGVIFFDKVVHLCEYAPFGFLVARALSGTSSEKSIKQLFILSVVFSFLYGLSDEIHQLFVVGRDASLSDLIADTIGGSLGGWIYLRGRKENQHDRN